MKKNIIPFLVAVCLVQSHTVSARSRRKVVAVPAPAPVPIQAPIVPLLEQCSQDIETFKKDATDWLSKIPGEAKKCEEAEGKPACFDTLVPEGQVLSQRQKEITARCLA